MAEAGELPDYHANLLEAMQRSHECAEAARVKGQERQARYYNRRVKQGRTFGKGDRVWIYNPPRGATATKFRHQWMGPARIVEAAGYDNVLLVREDKSGTPETIIAHVSFLVSYHYPEPLLERAAADIGAQLDYEAREQVDDDEAHAAPVRAAAAPRGPAAMRGATTAAERRGKRKRTTVGGQETAHNGGGELVEVRRRRRRNRVGQYVLEYELRPGLHDRAGGKWVSVAEYEKLLASGRVVEGPAIEEVV
ncbi:hypothetical protein PR002_g31691 [Phytophthora rubi]|uniref:Uncharacterized protein n=1 Tax=Phytophthora rubi TaxID=129364 RepID=A0A6A3GAW9_9STRA|nr:hypothetical protein PR002_g31691 [Phytophthora rubi]